ncbi:hypothetical protein, partial [Brucella sp. 22210]|uniref:hypothetical protein n=1 Tax=Brucella sp. 22210 TaxID=3453892 RepID=UPI003F8453A4
EASFALYLVHVTVIKLILTHRDLFGALPIQVLFCIYAAAGIAVSCVIYLIFEKPIRNWARGVQIGRKVEPKSTEPPQRAIRWPRMLSPAQPD